MESGEDALLPLLCKDTLIPRVIANSSEIKILLEAAYI